MEILDVTKQIDENKLEKFANGIKNGKLCLFPTETVYGIGTNGLDEKAVEKIYQAKKRSKKNPINLLVSDISMIETITQDISSLEYKLMEAFFPGPFTLILKKNDIVPSIVTANSNLVGVRIPNHPIAKKLVEFAKIPIATPSANISGKLSGTNLADVINEFANSIDFAIDGGNSNLGMESTIVRVIDNIPHILRPGSILPEEIKKIAGNVVLEECQTSLLPSSNLQHYQLDIDTCLVYSEENQEMIDKIMEQSKSFPSCVVLCCEENFSLYPLSNVIPIASKYDLENYSRNLFSAFRKASSLSPSIIFVEGVKKEGLGIAIMNRLENICNIVL